MTEDRDSLFSTDSHAPNEIAYRRVVRSYWIGEMTIISPSEDQEWIRDSYVR